MVKKIMFLFVFSATGMPLNVFGLGIGTTTELINYLPFKLFNSYNMICLLFYRWGVWSWSWARMGLRKCLWLSVSIFKSAVSGH
jgi:hypothetical protein